VTPGSVLDERRGVRLHLGGEVFRGGAETFGAPSFRPLIEHVPGGRVEHVRCRRREVGSRERPLTGPQECSSVVIDDFRSAPDDGEFELGLALAAQQ
jgi:hypothetical protein